MRFVMIIATALLVGSCAGPPSGFTGAWDARALLERSVAAHGGADRVLDFQDLSITSKLVVRQGKKRIKGETTTRLDNQGDLFFSVHLEGVGEKTIHTIRGEPVETIDGRATGRDVRDDILRKRRLAGIHGFFLEEDAVHTILDPPLTLAGKACARLTRNAGPETWQLWIDLDEFLVRKVSLLLKRGDPAAGLPGPLTIAWYYSRFSEHQGRMVPGAFRIMLNDTLFQEGEVTEFSLTPGSP